MLCTANTTGMNALAKQLFKGSSGARCYTTTASTKKSLLNSSITLTDTSGQKKSLKDIFEKKKVALVGVPGAFSGVCSTKHLPTYLTNAAKLKEKGIDQIVCVSVNDHFVMNAWANSLHSEDKISLYADPNAAFTKSIGMDVDLAGVFGNVRSKRYSMIVDNGEIVKQNVEGSPGDLNVAGAEDLLKQL